jgi:hypothetical protein
MVMIILFFCQGGASECLNVDDEVGLVIVVSVARTKGVSVVW